MLLIKNGHIKPIIGQELACGSILIDDNGKITAMGADLTAPEGAVCIENIEIDNFKCYPVKSPLPSWEGTKGDCRVGLKLETRLHNFRISNFSFVQEESGEKCIALEMRNTPNQQITADGVVYETKDKNDVVSIEKFRELKIDRI